MYPAETPTTHPMRSALGKLTDHELDALLDAVLRGSLAQHLDAAIKERREYGK